jgi:hypothetical protein
MQGKKIWGAMLAFVLLLTFVAPAFAGERPVDVRDLKGISPHRHRYLFSVIGGTLLGGGVGALIGGGHGNIAKGMLIGGGGLSALYLHSHRSAGERYRDWAFIGSHTALGLGAGWTICGCNRGAAFGTLAGAGGSMIWRAMAPQKNFNQVARMGKHEAKKAKNTVEKGVDKVTPNKDKTDNSGQTSDQTNTTTNPTPNNPTPNDNPR